MTTRKCLLCLTALLGVQASTIADDTDIYVDARPVSDAEPMVFLTLDYRPNLNSVICTEVSPKDPNGDCAQELGDAYPNLLTGPGQVTLFEGIRAVFKTLFDELDGVKVAFVLNHEDTCTGPNSGGGPSASGCSNGAYILQGLRSFDDNDSNGAKASMLTALNSLPSPQGNYSHQYQGKELYFEIFRYLTGQAWHNAHLGWEDFNTNKTFNLDVDNPQASWDPSIESGANYISPFIDTDEFACSQAFAVNIMFQVSNRDGDSDQEIKSAVASGGMNIGVGNPSFNDVIDHMYSTDFAPTPASGPWPEIKGEQNLQSYFITAQVNNTTNGYATAGGTNNAIPLTKPAILLHDLRVIFREVLSISTTLVAASVPVNVFNRSDIVDNVYLAQFAVDEDARPYWDGNLKKLRIVESIDSLGSKSLRLEDVFGEPAIAADGRIAYDALTYWTDASSLPPAEELEIHGRDGRSVPRGGAGQQIPGFLGGLNSIGDENAANTRTVYTEPDSGTNLMDLDVDSAPTLQADLGTATLSETENMIRWLRGQDVDDEDLDSNLQEARRWIMGPPLHSRPLPINYGARGSYTETNPDIRIFMGTDDGFMHSFRNTDTTGYESGVEDWAFMPREVMDRVSVLRDNDILEPHPYTIDGAPSAYVVDTDRDGTIGKDANGSPDPSDKVIMFFGMRRGGNSYYALDVTNPDAPELAWKITNDGDFAELGMSFSSPRVGTVQFGTDPTPAIFFGGGYDPDKDEGHGDDDEGNAIFVVNAFTGQLIWKATWGSITGSQGSTLYHHAGMVDSIPSDMSAVDTNADGNVDRLYVGDTGGTVWRVDLPESTSDNRSTWFVSELANLGRDDQTPVTNTGDRRFFHRPDFVPSSDHLGAFDGVIIGAGDRADPRDTVTQNWFYMIKDRNVVTGTVAGAPKNQDDFDAGSNPNGLGDITDTCIDDSNCFPVENLTNGWKMQMEQPGEKVLAPAITAFGTVFFTSYLPDGTGASAGTDCAPSEGGGRLYAVNISNGAPVNNYDATGGSAEKMTKTDRFQNLESGGIPAEVVPVGDFILPPDLTPESTGGRSFWKTFWYEKNIDD